MRIDVVGGSGFIGSRLCARLARDGRYNVQIIDKVHPAMPLSSYVQADVRSLPELAKAVRTEAALINLAAEHRDDVRPASLYSAVNVTGASNICAVATEKAINTIIFTSSVAVYGAAAAETDESGTIRPINEYGRTKYEAERIFVAWQNEQPEKRKVVIVRPTVVFGEQNRGNVYNLLRQIATGAFVMIGTGSNRKSMAYVENVAAFIEYSLTFSPGIHIYNFVDKPDFTMLALVRRVRETLGKRGDMKFRLPYVIGLLIGLAFDGASRATGKRFAISSLRVKKFCASSVFQSNSARTGFTSPVSIDEALTRTIRHEFLESHKDEKVFFSE